MLTKLMRIHNIFNTNRRLLDNIGLFLITNIDTVFSIFDSKLAVIQSATAFASLRLDTKYATILFSKSFYIG